MSGTHFYSRAYYVITKIVLRNYLMDPGAGKLLANDTPPNEDPPIVSRRKLSRREMGLLLGLLLLAATIGAGITSVFVLVGR